MKLSLTAYLQDLAECEVRSLQDLIDYNNEHADVELPPRMGNHSPSCLRVDVDVLQQFRLTYQADHPRQDNFIKSQNQNTSAEDYERHLLHLRSVARDRGVERVFEIYGVDVILGPTDSGLTSLATGGGKKYHFKLAYENKTKGTFSADFCSPNRLPSLCNAFVLPGLQWPPILRLRDCRKRIGSTPDQGHERMGGHLPCA